VQSLRRFSKTGTTQAVSLTQARSGTQCAKRELQDCIVAARKTRLQLQSIEDDFMSIIDKVVAAVTPPETDESRLKARNEARASAGRGDWLAMVLDHHEQVETAFTAVKRAADPASRISNLKKLSTLLTGHSIAEEAALYPALARVDEKGHAVKAYTKQSAAKLQLGLLEDLPPMSQEFVEARAYRRRCRLRGREYLVH